MGAGLVEQGERARLQGALIHEAVPARQMPQAEIVPDRKVVAERQLLVHHRDAGGERVAR